MRMARCRAAAITVAAAAVSHGVSASSRWPGSGANALVLQVGDNEYLAKRPPRTTGSQYQNFTIADLARSIGLFARVHGFSYSLRMVSPGVCSDWKAPGNFRSCIRAAIINATHAATGQPADLCSYDAKVSQIREALHSLREGDWLVYIDLDMQYACDDPRANDASRFGTLLPRVADDGSKCAMMAQDLELVINSGFLALRAHSP
jgi:hypothetical protein